MKFVFVFLACLLSLQFAPAQVQAPNIWEKFSVANTIKFEFGSIELDAGDKKFLDVIAADWKRYSEDWGELKMVFKGSTCPEELDADPYIHLKRCKVVLDYLMLRSKVDYRYFLIAALPSIEGFWDGSCTLSAVSFSF